MGEDQNQSTEDKTEHKDEQSQGEAKFTQADLDRVVQDRLNRDRAKYNDYDDLKKQVTEFKQYKEGLTQQEMEKKQEYEKLKDGWVTRENEYKQKLNEATLQVQSERVDNALTNEILKKNAYPDAVALLKPMVKYNEDGSISVRGKDANGTETDLSMDQGVEQFLKDRPYLVKGSGQGGAGTGNSGGSGETSGSENLAQQLQNAMAVGDRKLVGELKQKIRAKHSGQAMTIM